MRILLLLTILFALSGSAAAQSFLFDPQEDHIAANVPTREHFASYLERDLLAHFRSEFSPEVKSVTWELLREGATQSGVAYPKFYLWVRVTSKGGPLVEGAVRVAAVDRKGFDVTHFIPSKDVLADPQAVSSTFPSALIPAIKSRAGRR